MGKAAIFVVIECWSGVLDFAGDPVLGAKFPVVWGPACRVRSEFALHSFWVQAEFLQGSRWSGSAAGLLE